MRSRPGTTQAHVFGLPVHRVSRWIFNCYVIQRDAPAVFVDPGLPSTAGDALELARRLGLDLADTQTASTHGHSDHVGGVPLLHEQLGASVHLPRRCQAYLAGEPPRVFGSDAAVRFMPMYTQQPFDLVALKEFARGAKNIGFGLEPEFSFPIAPDGYLSEGGHLPGNAEWDVIETPGHTDDAVCFYHRDSATLLSGDAVLTLDGRAWFNPEWVDTTASENTEERLRSLDVKYLLPGHGRPISGDVWRGARSFREKPDSRGVLSSCARKLGNWDY